MVANEPTTRKALPDALAFAHTSSVKDLSPLRDRNFVIVVRQERDWGGRTARTPRPIG